MKSERCCGWSVVGLSLVMEQSFAFFSIWRVMSDDVT